MKIISHRGSGNKYKENSVLAILESLKQNYTDGVEFDIRITKDFHFVICHDPFYKGYLISETKVKTLTENGLNTLEEVLDRIKSEKIIMIEVKEERDKYRILSAKLNRILKKYNLNYYIQSFNYNFVNYFKKKYSDFKVGLLIGVKMNVNMINNDFDFISINYRHVNRNFKNEVFVWTINDKKRFDKLKGRFNIITDNPEYFYNIMKGN